jgi:Necrosis inducing protein (NPP1)
MSLTQATLCAGLMMALGAPSHADNFFRLDAALPVTEDIRPHHPVFDFDGDGCLPSAGISRAGAKNGGLHPSGALGGGCRAHDFYDTSNTLHRHACIDSAGRRYCGHFYALYMMKDQVTVFGGGHRHDWEHAAVWTTNGVVTHGGYSAHGKLYNKPLAELPMQDGHLKIVYHKDGVSTHAMRFAKQDEVAENPYGMFLMPNVTSWYTLQGDGIDNPTMRARLNSFDYGSATIPVRDDNFLDNLNTSRPAGYPAFTAASVDGSR